MVPEPSFEISVPVDESPSETLLVGLPTLGLAGLTAVDHLVKRQSATEIGYVETSNFPDITPFKSGTPRLPLRLYHIPPLEVTVLVGEQFIPPWAADPFVDALQTWASSTELTEITVLHGVPFPHGPDEHDVFHVVSPDFRTDQLVDAGVAPLKEGYLDGVVSELMTNAITGTGPSVGVLVIPTHPPGPDFDAAVLFLEALERVYDFTVDEQELRQRAAELKQYYSELAGRMDQFENAEQSMGGRSIHDDRAFM